MSVHEVMQDYVRIVLFDQEKKNILLRKRTNTPDAGLYDFLGAKRGKEDGGISFAYRKLHEACGLSRDEVDLTHCMDVLYYLDHRKVEVYAGVLRDTGNIGKGDHLLKWFGVDTDFSDESVFAAGGKISMILEEAIRCSQGTAKGYCIGIDGCKEGWVVAYLDDSGLCVERYRDIQSIMKVHADACEILIDMVVGLPESVGDIRPDSFARRILVGKSMAIFAVPCRQAVYETDEEKMIRLNKQILDKGLGRQTIAIIPKMREVDMFLTKNPHFISRIKESHPEVCFSRLKGETVMTNKSKQDGMEERIEILKEYIDDISEESIREMAKQHRCAASDIIDAACLAITANLSVSGDAEVIPKIPMQDRRGILMRMTIPKSNKEEEDDEDAYSYGNLSDLGM